MVSRNAVEETAPKTGFAHWTLKGHLIFILGVPAIVMWLVTSIFFRKKN
jgi:hypothetical protein